MNHSERVWTRPKRLNITINAAHSGPVGPEADVASAPKRYSVKVVRGTQRIDSIWKHLQATIAHQGSSKTQGAGKSSKAIRAFQWHFINAGACAVGRLRDAKVAYDARYQRGHRQLWPAHREEMEGAPQGNPAEALMTRAPPMRFPN